MQRASASSDLDRSCIAQKLLDGVRSASVWPIQGDSGRSDTVTTIKTINKTVNYCQKSINLISFLLPN